MNGVGVRGASDSLAPRIGLVLPDSSRELLGVCNEELRLFGATGVDCAVGNDELVGDSNPKLSDWNLKSNILEFNVFCWEVLLRFKTLF